MIELVMVFFVCIGLVLFLFIGINGIIKQDKEIKNIQEKLKDEIENHLEAIKDECIDLLTKINENSLIPADEWNKVFDSMVQFYYNDELEKLVKLRHMLRGAIRKMSEGVKA